MSVHSHHRPLSSHFLIIELRLHQFWARYFADQLIHYLNKGALMFTHLAGEQHHYQLTPLKTDGSPGVSTQPVTYVSDNPTACAVTVNAGVANGQQCLVQYLSAGSANITATGANENGTAYQTTFQCVCTAPPSNFSDHFKVEEVD